MLFRITPYIFLFFFFSMVFPQKLNNKYAPDFSLPDLNGNTYRFSQNLGKKLIVIKFWTTYCIGCRQELRKLNKIYEKYKDDGLEIICISVDGPKTVSKVSSLIKTNKFKYTVLLDTNNEIMHLFQVAAPPYTFLINEEGKIIYSRSGYRPGDEKILERKIKMHLDI